MKKVPENLQASLVSFIKANCASHPVCFYDKQMEQGDWVACHKPYNPLLMVEANGAYAIADCSYGYLFLFDGKKWHYSASGTEVITNQFAFVADYYGYSEGALFARIGVSV